ncbi:MAG: hypothetical protein EBZ47_03585 [Chlamydiae bacterium]|nr:hypothetical protein [Chlamydiota bacterium]
MNDFRKKIEKNQDQKIEQITEVTPVYNERRTDIFSSRNSFQGSPIEKNIEYLLYHFLQVNKDFIEQVREKFREAIPQDLSFSIGSFKKKLTELCHKDESENLHYVESLSENWHEILFHARNKSFGSSYSEDLQKLIDSILNFPDHSDHSLGFYLNQHAGKDWTPLPLMNLLKNLHLNYQSDPSTSELANWLNLLTQIRDVIK